MERGIRANASKRSHAELDAAPDLDAGDPAELAAQYAAIRRTFPSINLLGVVAAPTLATPRRRKTWHLHAGKTGTKNSVRC
jgi:hypothetical protein